jgi:type IX secretion system substrate protein
MAVYWSGPGIKRQLIPKSAFTQTPEPTTNSFEITSANRLKGPADDLAKTDPEIIRVYPNPFNSLFYVDFYNTASVNDITATILDLQGRIVYTHHAGKLAAGKNTITIPYSGSQLSEGIYLVTLNVNGIASKTIRLIKLQQ